MVGQRLWPEEYPVLHVLAEHALHQARNCRGDEDLCLGATCIYQQPDNSDELRASAYMQGGIRQMKPRTDDVLVLSQPIDRPGRSIDLRICC